ncbi:glutathione S-transferase family protein [Pseudomonas cavernicola]|uniref:Glutathione S-transferase family protein n=1 Tax=Pseudomonas cavernicola TaxID=2320866 RepID=A0A418XMN8_9PSED|nr:glutathione S-transferase family protein [Pseudomonas cavernicola]RJG13728.1 glutathione S-transferase family protein [Pseudomonas cavernicola]
MRLHDFDLSGNCYKVQLFLSLIGQHAERVSVDLRGGEHKRPAFLAINPRGQVPTLEDGSLSLGDSQAILVYLARRYADEHWYPLDPASQGRVAGWLSFAANEVQHGPGLARLGKLFGAPIDELAVTAKATKTLELLNTHLAEHQWLAQAAEPSIADVAVYPYVALAGDGGLDLTPYAHLHSWFARLRELPGYIGMPGL